jgi:hypothetical protein
MQVVYAEAYVHRPNGNSLYEDLSRGNGCIRHALRFQYGLVKEVEMVIRQDPFILPVPPATDY